jgi:hypothetical protein
MNIYFAQRDLDIATLVSNNIRYSEITLHRSKQGSVTHFRAKPLTHFVSESEQLNLDLRKFLTVKDVNGTHRSLTGDNGCRFVIPLSGLLSPFPTVANNAGHRLSLMLGYYKSSRLWASALIISHPHCLRLHVLFFVCFQASDRDYRRNCKPAVPIDFILQTEGDHHGPNCLAPYVMD